jgi:uncharacterized membrane protein
MQSQINLPKQRKRAGLLKTSLLVMCLGISLFGWLRLTGALSIYTLLLELGIKPHPLYYLLSGLAIGLSFLVAFLGSALNRGWAGVYVRICSAMLAVHLLTEIFFIRGRVNIIQVILALAASSSLFILTSRNHQKNEFTS